jgi:hypothetical protein
MRFILHTAFLGLACAVMARDPVIPYEGSNKVVAVSRADIALSSAWKAKGLLPPYVASDNVFVRRVYLCLGGRLPTVDEAKSFVDDPTPKKYGKLIDSLLESESFLDYWTMKWCDALRVKSEFPINLWPNAVYGYQRRIRTFLKKNEPYDAFARALLTTSGSNFRAMEVNFYRAMAERTPDGIAQAVGQTFMGIRVDKLTPQAQTNMAAFFNGVIYSSTQEWKEEIVYWKPIEAKRSLVLPNHKKKSADETTDARMLFADYLTSDSCDLFAKAAVNRVWYWMYGEGLYTDPDDLNSTCINEKLVQELAEGFVDSKYDFKALCRVVASSVLMRASSVGGNDAESKQAFAVFPVRRMDAEVLQDAIRDISNTSFDYSSVIPEPFTYIPENNRTVTLADGSINSQFLILFGRPARDTGFLTERNNEITSKQMLFLYNSGDLYRRVSSIVKLSAMKKLKTEHQIEHAYWMFYSRPLMGAEKKQIQEATLKADAKNRYRIYQDVGWQLLNSKEFIYIH